MGFYPKRSVPDADYLLRRAETEARLADRAKDEVAADAHHTIANTYLGRLFGDPGNETGKTPLSGPSFDSRTATMLAIRNAFRSERDTKAETPFSDIFSRLDEIE